MRRARRPDLKRRQIFTPRALELIDQAERDGGLDGQDADAFVQQALETFRWHSDATVDAAAYEALQKLTAWWPMWCASGGPAHQPPDAAHAGHRPGPGRMPARGMDARTWSRVRPSAPAPSCCARPASRRSRRPYALPAAPAPPIPRASARSSSAVALTRKGRALYDKLLGLVR